MKNEEIKSNDLWGSLGIPGFSWGGRLDWSQSLAVSRIPPCVRFPLSGTEADASLT